MRKSAVMVFVLVLFSASMAFAVPEENCGCGLGSMILEGQDGLISQLAATVTNGISGNQTFGITTGTLGCEKADSIVMNEKVNIFVAENMDNLAIDIASGQGETLDALADIAEVSSEKRAELYASLQNNFDDIYFSANVTNEDVSSKVINIIAQI